MHPLQFTVDPRSLDPFQARVRSHFVTRIGRTTTRPWIFTGIIATFLYAVKYGHNISINFTYHVNSIRHAPVSPQRSVEELSWAQPSFNRPYSSLIQMQFKTFSSAAVRCETLLMNGSCRTPKKPHYVTKIGLVKSAASRVICPFFYEGCSSAMTLRDSGRTPRSPALLI